MLLIALAAMVTVVAKTVAEVADEDWQVSPVMVSPPSEQTVSDVPEFNAGVKGTRVVAAHPVALPLASMPVGAWPVEHSDGVAASAVAVAALPVVDWFSVATRAAANVPLPMLLALVVSVVAEAASPDTSPAAGCACAGTPALEIEVKN